MKSVFKKIIVGILGAQVRRLRAKNNFKIIGVVGSIGKTSTKLAIGKILESEMRVRYQVGNYNDLVSVPLVFFGHQMPNVWNIFAWINILIQNEFQIFSNYDYDVVVLELGTDGPNQINQFRKYLHLDIAIITAVTLEHMEFFQNLDEVATEEWSVSFFSDVVFVNKDLVSEVPENIDHKKIIFYGKTFGTIYKLENVRRSKTGFDFEISYKGGKMLDLSYDTVSELTLYSILVSVAISRYLEISPTAVKERVPEVKAFAGRLQQLRGKEGATLIDDTYNASPLSMRLALETLYAQPQKQKIAILGMMNELGKISKTEHERVGEYCDPKNLSLLVTVGRDAKYIAEKARERGCEVYEAEDSRAAGEFVLPKLDNDTVVLAKGSQNGVFTEEALKPLLLDLADIPLLVRQDPTWLRKKGIG